MKNGNVPLSGYANILLPPLFYLSVYLLFKLNITTIKNVCGKQSCLDEERGGGSAAGNVTWIGKLHQKIIGVDIESISYIILFFLLLLLLLPLVHTELFLLYRHLRKFC